MYYTVAGKRWKAVPSLTPGSCIGCEMYHHGAPGTPYARDCGARCKSKDYFNDYTHIFVLVEPEDEEIAI